MGLIGRVAAGLSVAFVSPFITLPAHANKVLYTCDDGFQIPVEFDGGESATVFFPRRATREARGPTGWVRHALRVKWHRAAG